jgi:hypothetical protein
VVHPDDNNGSPSGEDRHPFGEGPAERDRILEDIATAEPRLRHFATVEISTDTPLRELVDKTEALAGNPVSDHAQR